MHIHEHQSKEILKGFGITVPDGRVALDADGVVSAVESLETNLWVVKAQIHAGGRGKAGGVKLIKDKSEAVNVAKSMFGKVLVTPQTGSDGQVVSRVYVETGCDIKSMYYVSVILDRVTSTPVFMVSAEGGTEIEEVAEKNPEKIKSLNIKNLEILPFHARDLAFFLGFKGDLVKKFSDVVYRLYKVFVDLDCDQVEINPLVLDDNENFVALDAKISFDENALFRHKDILKYRDPSEENPLETRAKENQLSYVKMDGNIGCMVNGAGLAMATMDIIKYYGGEPANFLDVGGGATKERVAEAFKIILSDSKVKVVLVNIFGGIMKCDVIAEGILDAVKSVGVNVPLVVRLAGTNFELGKKILDESGFQIISAYDLEDAAKKAVGAL